MLSIPEPGSELAAAASGGGAQLRVKKMLMKMTSDLCQRWCQCCNVSPIIRTQTQQGRRPSWLLTAFLLPSHYPGVEAMRRGGILLI